MKRKRENQDTNGEKQDRKEREKETIQGKE